MTVSALGYGKRTSVDLYRVQSRGGKGIINFKVTPKTGPVIGARPVSDDEALVLLTSTNKIMRMSVDEIRSVGRATMGVRLVRLDEGARVVAFDTVNSEAEDGEAIAGKASVETSSLAEEESAAAPAPESGTGVGETD